MKITAMRGGATYIASSEEIENIFKIMKNRLFKDTDNRLGCNIRFECDNDGINENGKGDFSYVATDKESDAVIAHLLSISYEPAKDKDGNVIADSYTLTVEPCETKLTYDEKTGVSRPETYDFSEIYSNIMTAVEIILEQKDSFKAIVPASAKKTFQLKLLNKIYTGYRLITDRKGNFLTDSEINKHVMSGDILIQEFVKLEKSCDFDKDSKLPVLPFSGKWIHFGVAEGHREYEVVVEKDLKAKIGVDPYESTVQMWDMIESGKIVPLFVTNPQSGIKNLLNDSQVLVQRILCENANNAAFSKTGILLGSEKDIKALDANTAAPKPLILNAN